MHAAIGISLFISTFITTLDLMAQAEPRENLVAAIEVQMRKGNHTEALALANQMIARNPKSGDGYYAKGKLYEQMGDYEKALGEFTHALQYTTNSAQLYEQRGNAYCRLGKFTEALADYDRETQITPKAAPYLWQRGIAYYEIGKFAEGRNQFLLHQGVNPNDTENAVWHFLCVARLDGFAKARESLMTVKNDARVPMREIHGLFAGLTPMDDVLAAAKKADASDQEKKSRLFYANFYGGLFYEARGEIEKGAKLMKTSLETAPANDFMADLARAHLARLGPRPERAK
jgi:lipoprotein NlpI